MHGAPYAVLGVVGFLFANSTAHPIGVDHLQAADPITDDLHAAGRRQGRFASLRDGLRPPLTPTDGEQWGWLSGRRLSYGRVPLFCPRQGRDGPRVPLGTPHTSRLRAGPRE